MEQRHLVFGADGGGTKTAGAIARSDGTVLARQTTGPSNQNVIGFETALKQLSGLVNSCCKDAGCSPADIRSAVLGLAGAGDKDERSRIERELKKVLEPQGFGGIRIGIEMDTRIALEGAFDGSPGIIVIAGTGSNVLGKNGEGEVVSAGGWGRILGDEGSGYRVGLEAIRLFTHVIDGREDGGIIRTLVEEKTGWRSRQDVVNAVYKGRFDVASLAPLVLNAAEGGDTEALAILEKNGRELAGQVATVAERLQFTGEIPVAFVGGMLSGPNGYAEIFQDEVRKVVPRAVFGSPRLSPLDGAIRMALTLMKQVGGN